ncbi:MAG TPA: DNA polymerase III subunit gamma/tau [Candidatus Paceibacterota bacterium]|jgi:DNA polymerase-3 subunit gamma/tau
MHQSLYRKYRPQTFKDVVGQDQVIVPLKDQLENETVGHAYLFAGSRGLGKTSIARIFARELKTGLSDLYEIDAASNNSVEDVRALTENVYTLPFESKYKVYILDEAHMLSKSAWNAFLKTLEEPPAHTIFILATTELERVPETVRSRCQVYEFKKPSREGLSRHVASIAKQEGYTIDPSVHDLVALLADGSYRDALSILEKVFSSSNDKSITREEAERATGAPRLTLIEDLVRALSEGSIDSALSALRTASAADVDMQLYLTLLLEYVRNVLLVRHAPELRKEISGELGSDLYASVESLATAGDSKVSHRTLKVFLDAASRIRYAPIPALALELSIYELLGDR